MRKTPNTCVLLEENTEAEVRIGQNITIGKISSERVYRFKYLGTAIAANINGAEETELRLLAGNRCVCLIKAFESKNLLNLIYNFPK